MLSPAGQKSLDFGAFGAGCKLTVHTCVFLPKQHVFVGLFGEIVASVSVYVLVVFTFTN